MKKDDLYMLDMPDDHWIKRLAARFPNGARWNDDRGTWEAVEEGDLDFTWSSEPLVPYDNAS